MPLHTGPMAARVLDSFARVVSLPRTRLDQPGTSVVTTDDRSGTGAAAFYRVGAHAVLWADPALRDRLTPLGDSKTTLSRAEAGEALEALGLSFVADADVRVLSEAGPTEPGALAPGYDHRWLSAGDPADVDLVRAFADRSDPDDVEEAALDELDDFAEHAISVVTPAGQPDHLVGYASACDWEWDADFADIGVLVDPAHRGAGLGHFVVRHTVARLLEQGHIPLYRHPHYIEGSMAIAIGAGFVTAATLAFYSLSDQQA